MQKRVRKLCLGIDCRYLTVRTLDLIWLQSILYFRRRVCFSEEIFFDWFVDDFRVPLKKTSTWIVVVSGGNGVEKITYWMRLPGILIYNGYISSADVEDWLVSIRWLFGPLGEISSIEYFLANLTNIKSATIKTFIQTINYSENYNLYVELEIWIASLKTTPKKSTVQRLFL